MRSTAAREAAGAPAAQTTVRRAGGGLDAQAEAAALAAQEFTAVAGVGDDARAAVGLAQSAQVGAGTHWVAVR